MSTPGYPGNGVDPYAQGQHPQNPAVGAPPVPGAAGGAPQAGPDAAAPQGAHAGPRPGAYVPQSGDIFAGDGFAGNTDPGAAQRPFAAYAQVPVDPYALAAAAPLGALDDPYAPRAASERPGAASAPFAGTADAGAGTSAQAAPAQPDPYAAGVPAAYSDAPAAYAGPAAAPAAPGAAGPIDFVPGITQDPPVTRAEPAARPEPAPAEGAGAVWPGHPEPAAPAAPAHPEAEAPFADEPGDAAAEPEAAAGVELVWDDGSAQQLDGRVIIGRNPAPEEGATIAAVRDETLSLSKTHFEIDASGDGVWLTDRHSTNGVTIVRGGERIAATAGERTALQPGDALEMGDRAATLRGRA